MGCVGLYLFDICIPILGITVIPVLLVFMKRLNTTKLLKLGWGRQNENRF